MKSLSSFRTIRPIVGRFNNLRNSTKVCLAYFLAVTVVAWYLAGILGLCLVLYAVVTMTLSIIITDRAFFQFLLREWWGKKRADRNMPVFMRYLSGS